MKALNADVVIAGSGAGGSTIAGELLRAGAKVVILEAGPVRFGTPGLHARNLDSTPAGTPAFGRIILDQWGFPCGDDKPVHGLDGLWVSHGVGGMFSIFCSNLPYPDVSELPEWFGPGEWAPFLDRSAKLLHANADIFGRGVRAGRIKAAVEAGLGNLDGRRAITHMPIGVRETAQGLKYTGADDLLEGDYDPANLTLLPGHIVREVLVDGSRATGLRAISVETGEELTVSADFVVVAGGPVATSQIIANSRVEAGPAFGRYILDHPIISTSVTLKPEITEGVPADDPMFSVWIPFSKNQQWQNEVFRFPSAAPEGVPEHHMADVATFVAMDVNPDNAISYSRDRKDKFGLPEISVNLVHSAADHKRIADAAAENYLVSAAVADTRKGWFPILYKAGGSAHLSGTCRMGPKDDGTSVVDRNGRFWGYDNLYAAGNATLTVPSGANPTFTAVAAALMSADDIRARASKG